MNSTHTAAILGALLVSLACSVQAAESGGKADTRRKSTSITFHQSPSEESPAARQARLKRECKGRVNAGMCLGYTR